MGSKPGTPYVKFRVTKDELSTSPFITFSKGPPYSFREDYFKKNRRTFSLSS